MRPRAVVATVLATTLAFAGGAVRSASPSAAPTLQVMVVSTQLWMGVNDLLLDLLGTDGSRLDDPGLVATVVVAGPSGLPRTEQPLERIRLSANGRYLYRARVVLDAVGTWSSSVTARTGSGSDLEGRAAFAVLDDAGTPSLGQPAVAVRTPTLGGLVADLATITSDSQPLPQLYWWSLDEALRQGRPILYVIDTVRPGVNDACGSAVGEARAVGGSFPGLVAIHAEPYVTAVGDQVLVDASQGPGRISPWVAAWGVTEPPWMFVIAEDGTVRAKFQGIFGTDELMSALRRVAPYMPGSH